MVGGKNIPSIGGVKLTHDLKTFLRVVNSQNFSFADNSRNFWYVPRVVN